MFKEKIYNIVIVLHLQVELSRFDQNLIEIAFVNNLFFF